MGGSFGFELVTFFWGGGHFLRKFGFFEDISQFTPSQGSPHVQETPLHNTQDSSLPVFPLALPRNESVKLVPLAGTTSGTWGGRTFFLATTSPGASGTLKILILWHVGAKRITTHRKHAQTAEDISRPFTLPATYTFIWRKRRLFARNLKCFLFKGGFFISVQHFKRLVFVHLVLWKSPGRRKYVQN